MSDSFTVSLNHYFLLVFSSLTEIVIIFMNRIIPNINKFEIKFTR